jgi:predicted 3-demethylubiquinone-9 3-methyltransferase (glyoxalase superfamily)
MAEKVMTLLTINGQAEAALNCYTSLFADARIVFLKKYTASGPGKEGAVQQAQFTIGGSQYICMDLPPGEPLKFASAASLYVQCSSQQELEQLFTALSKAGHVWIAPAPYGSSHQFCWIRDRFGVSWQLDYPFSEAGAGEHNLCYANSPEVRKEYKE